MVDISFNFCFVCGRKLWELQRRKWSPTGSYPKDRKWFGPPTTDPRREPFACKLLFAYSSMWKLFILCNAQFSLFFFNASVCRSGYFRDFRLLLFCGSPAEGNDESYIAIMATIQHYVDSSFSSQNGFVSSVSEVTPVINRDNKNREVHEQQERIELVSSALQPFVQ